MRISIKIIMVFFLFCLYSPILLASGQTEAELREELQEEHNIRAFPIAQTTLSIQYVFIGENTIIQSGLVAGEILTEYNLQTQETCSIASPEEWIGRRIESIYDLQYDSTSNILHSIVIERLPSNDTISLYYLLHLDDNTWEEITGLRNIIYQNLYVSEEKLLYIVPIHGEDILVFDMESREFVFQIDLLGDEMQTYALYGNPLHILGRTKSDGVFQYYLYDTGSRTGQIFPNIEFISEGIALHDYIYIDSNRFLCINGYQQYYSEIIELDLIAGTKKVVALKSFPRDLGNLKRVDDRYYSFLTRSDDNWVLLCIMEYD